MADIDSSTLTSLTVQLLSAYVSNNNVASEDLAGLIQTTRKALFEDAENLSVAAEPEYIPAVTVRKSIASKDHIVSMIDGKSYKTLKRHLATHGLTPEGYRKRYNLPADYPLVAPSYSERRRDVAARMGLGRNRGKTVSKPAEVAATPAVAVAPKAKRKAAPAKPAATAAKVKTPAVAAPAPVSAPATAAPAKSTAAKAPAATKSKLKLKLGSSEAVAPAAKTPASEAKPNVSDKAAEPKKSRAKKAPVAASKATKPKAARVKKVTPPTAPSVDPVVKPS